MSDIVNAKVQSTRLTIEDCGVLSAWLYLDYGGASQGFGGYTLDGKPVDGSHDRTPWAGAGLFIRRCLEICNVDSWEKLPGASIRVRKDGSRVHAIGHFLKDEWFDPEKDFSSLIEGERT